MNIKKSFEKIISLIIIFIIIFSPATVFAFDVNINASTTAPNTNNNYVPTGDAYNPQNPWQTVPKATVVDTTTGAPKATVVNENTLTPEYVNSQIQGSILSTAATSSTANTQSRVGTTATGVAGCFGAQILAQAIVQNVTNIATDAASKLTDVVFNVPTSESGSVGASIKTETSARVGTGISVFGFNIPTAPSWDSMAYCIVNNMIIYIANSTLEWVNSGFEGNPAFLENPDQFFEDLANQEKVAFIQNLAYGANSSVCGVFKSSIVSAVLSRYKKNQNTYGQGYQSGGYGGTGAAGGANFNGCPLDQGGQLNLFVGGNFSAGGGWDSWFNLTQNSQNNPYDTYFRTNERLNSQVQAVQISKTRELNWNNGYLSFRKCETETQNKKDCPITTPGTVIQSKLNSTLNLGTNRLVLAEKFDQVVTAVVDQLITTAIDKTLEAVND